MTKQTIFLKSILLQIIGQLPVFMELRPVIICITTILFVTIILFGKPLAKTSIKASINKIAVPACDILMGGEPLEESLKESLKVLTGYMLAMFLLYDKLKYFIILHYQNPVTTVIYTCIIITCLGILLTLIHMKTIPIIKEYLNNKPLVQSIKKLYNLLISKIILPVRRLLISLVFAC